MSFLQNSAQMPDRCEPGEFSSRISGWLTENQLPAVLLRVWGVKVSGKKRKNIQPDFNKYCGQLEWNPNEQQYHVGQFLTMAACDPECAKSLKLDLGHFYVVQAEDGQNNLLTQTQVAVGEIDDEEDEDEGRGGRGSKRPEDRMQGMFERFVESMWTGMEQRMATGMSGGAGTTGGGMHGLPFGGGSSGGRGVTDLDQIVQIEPGVFMTQREVVNRSKRREAELARLAEEREELRERAEKEPDPQTEQMNSMMKAGMLWWMNKEAKKAGDQASQDPMEKLPMLMAAGFSMEEIKELAQMQAQMAQAQQQSVVGSTVGMPPTGHVPAGPATMFDAMSGPGFMNMPAQAAGAVHGPPTQGPPLGSPFASVLDNSRPMPSQPTGRSVEDDEDDEDDEDFDDDDGFVDEEDEYMAELTKDITPFSRALYKQVDAAIKGAIKQGNYAGIKELAIAAGKQVFVPLFLESLHRTGMSPDDATDYLDGVFSMDAKVVAEAMFQGLSVPQKMTLKSLNMQDEARNIFASTIQQLATERAQAANG